MKRLPSGLGVRPTLPRCRGILELAGVTTRAKRRSLAGILFRRLQARCSRRTIDSRWLDIAVLLALAPESRSFVERIFRPSADTNLAQTRFTACIVMGREAVWGRADGIRWVLPFVVGHLAGALADVRFSTFACGCLLGMEWPTRESLPILSRLARTARCPVGRREAVHGLQHVAERGERRAGILRLLRTIEEKDRSPSVRMKAAWTRQVIEEERRRPRTRKP